MSRTALARWSERAESMTLPIVQGKFRRRLARGQGALGLGWTHSLCDNTGRAHRKNCGQDQGHTQAMQPSHTLNDVQLE